MLLNIFFQTFRKYVRELIVFKLNIDHMTLIKLEVGSTESLSSIMPPQGFVVESHFDTLLPEKCSLSEITPPRQFCSPALDDSIYDIPPPPKLVNESSPR